MATVKITKKTVDKLQPAGIHSWIWDSQVLGFGVRCQSNGRRYFVLKYRTGGRQRWYTIGQYGSPWTVDNARKEAMRLLMEVARGNDPAAARDLDKRAKTVSEFCDAYLNDYAMQHKKPRSWKSDEANIRNHIKPLIGHLKVKSVSRNDIDTLKRLVREGKTSVSRKLKPRVRLRALSEEISIT